MRSHRRSATNTGFVVFIGLCITSCGGGGSTASSPAAPTPAPAPAPTVTALAVTGPGCTAGAIATGLIRVPTLCTATALNSTIQLTATATLSDSTTQNVTSQAQWSTTNAAVATVSSQGLVTVLGQGESDVVAVYQGRVAGQTIRAALKPLISAINRGTTNQGGPILIQTEKRGIPATIDTVSRVALQYRVTLDDGRVAQLTSDHYRSSDIAADGTFWHGGEESYTTGTFHADGSVTGRSRMVLDFEGQRYVTDLTFTTTPSVTVAGGPF